MILDNCEHVLEPVAELTARLLREAPGARVLATSQEPLDLPGEHLLRLKPLALPVENRLESLLDADAARLLVDRILERDADFVFDERDAQHVVAICERLDGSPLGLELIAGQIAAAGLATARVSLERGDAAASTGRGRPDRHRSVTASAQWSYDLLTPEQRTVWARVAVFTAPFQLDAAVEVVAYEPLTVLDAERAIAALVNKSVLARVRAADGDRYLMHHAVREYGLERLKEGDQYEPTADRHAAWATEFMRKTFMSTTPIGWYDSFAVSRPDIVAAWHYLDGAGRASDVARLGAAAALKDFYYGRRREGQSLIFRLAEDPATATPEVLIVAAEVLSGNADTLEKAATYLKSAAQPGLKGRLEEWADAVHTRILRRMGDLDALDAAVQKQLNKQTHVSRRGNAAALQRAMTVALMRLDLSRAERYAVQTASAAKQEADLNLVSHATFDRATICALDGRTEEALALLRQARENTRQWANAPIIDMLLISLRDGPAAAAGVVAKLRMLTEEEFEFEPHWAPELMLILQGAHLWRALAVAAGALRWHAERLVQQIPLFEKLVGDAAARAAPTG